MGYVICVFVSCTITYILIRCELDRLWQGLTDVSEKASEWSKEDKERINTVVRDINKYYGRVEDESDKLIYPPGTGELAVEYRKLLQAAMLHYGHDTQLTVVVEECAELIQQICKYQRGLYNNISMAEEIADVEIMIEQLKLMWDLEVEEKEYHCICMGDVVSELNCLISFIVDRHLAQIDGKDLYDLEYRLKWLKDMLDIHSLVEVQKAKKLNRLRDRLREAIG